MGRDVKLPPTLLFPVEIVELYATEGAAVRRHDRLIKFKYWNLVPDGVPEEGEEPQLVKREFYGHFDSPHDGTLTKWLVRRGDRVNDELTPVLEVTETCDHSVQFGGLCALCGRSLDDKDYMGYSDVDRAPIAMSHDTAGLTVSREEAERIQTTSTRHLLAAHKLILVVDLDQTVIHASVSPEVARWIADPEAPQHEAVRDVRSFALRERGQQHQNWYFVKLRPGLAEFLERMSSMYEMHVYTMATRQYALEIAKVIDPDGKYFADRILSRDASGNMLYKDLKRLFPVSTHMVTIIDDRGDVWNWSPNLVRVVPYQFWTNTGDINSQFLPKRSGLVTPDSMHPSASDDVANTDNDTELESVGKALAKLHERFYAELSPETAKEVQLEPDTGEDENNNSRSSAGSTTSSSSTSSSIDEKKLPDVGKLLPAMKSRVFDGCVILFSGFFPLGSTDLDSADIVQWVRSFGAVVLADFLPSVTHVVARNAGTLKARQAAGLGKRVVNIDWVFSCIERWEHVDETPFVMRVSNPVIPGSAEDLSIKSKEDEDDYEGMDPNIAEGFMRSLQRGDVNWDAMDEELKELLDHDTSEGDDDNDEEAETKGANEVSNEGEDANKDEEAHGIKRKRDEENEVELDLDEDWD